MFRNYLVVSNSAKTREALAASLRARGYSVTLAASGAEALAVVKNVAVDTVLVDSTLKDSRGEQLRKQLGSARPECRVVLFTSFAAVRGTMDLLRFGENDFVVRKTDLIELLQGAVEGGGGEGYSPLAEKGKAALVEVVDVLVGLLELGDDYFGGFSHQAMRLARAVAEEMSHERETLDEVVVAALLRDIGKAGIAREVIHSGGEYSEQQLREMQSHVESGLRLLEHIDFPWKVLPVIRHHHERYDGRGYPDGLKGREIPIGARILAVVDAFIAMVSDRPHRPALAPEEALDELIRNAGTQFDPEVVEVFLRVMEKKYPIRGKQERDRIVIIDPNEEFRNLLKLRLINDNFDVEAVGTADEAMDAILGKGCDLVLADIRPGAGDLFQLFREIREDELLRAVPFIVLSERDDRVLKVRALRLGVDDFILKTVDLDEMIARIENVLTREAQRRETHRTERRRGITGRLENLSLPDIVQTLHIGMKTALVTLSSGKTTGRIWFDEGCVKHAKVNGIEGEEAFYELLRWNGGDFSIEHGIRGKKITVSSDPLFLLMEGLRLLDEERESEPAAPPVLPSED